MELKKCRIQRDYDKILARSQMNLTDDYSLPDQKLPMKKILMKRGNLQIRDVHTEKSKVRIRGNLKLEILYETTDSQRPLEMLETEHGFDEILYMDGAKSGDHLKLDWKIESLQISLIHPEKISIRCSAALTGTIIGQEVIEAASGCQEEEGLYQKQGQLTYLESVVSRKDQFRVGEEMVLPPNLPNIQRILWKDLEIQHLETEISEGVIVFKGEQRIFVIYEGEEDQGRVSWWEQKLPFYEKMELPEISSSVHGTVETELGTWQLEVKPDRDGELRQIFLETTLDLYIRLYEEQTVELLEDAYCEDQQMLLKIDQGICQQFRMEKTLLCKVQHRISGEFQGKILVTAARLYGESIDLSEQGGTAEGTLQVQVLFFKDHGEENFESAEFEIPYQESLEIPGIQKEDSWILQQSLDYLQAEPMEGGAEIKAVIKIHCCVMEPKEFSYFSELECKEEPREDRKEQPAMIIHFVQPQESLWQIAKDHRISVEEILKYNEGSGEEVRTGEKLLLCKSPKDVIL